MVLKRRHILCRFTTMKTHERVFETQFVLLWREARYHLHTMMVNKKGATKFNKEDTPLEADAHHRRTMRVHRREGERTGSADLSRRRSSARSPQPTASITSNRK